MLITWIDIANTKTLLKIYMYVLLKLDYYVLTQTHIFFIGPILDDRLKEKKMKPWKGAHSSQSVCPSVNKLQGTPFDLGT